MKALVLAAITSLSTAAEPTALEARETARVLPARTWRVGVFNPLQIGLGGGFEVQTHPLVFFVSPNVVLRKQALDTAGWTLSGELGLSVPTFAFQLLRGYLFPTNAEIGWMVVPRLGAFASFGEQHVTTISADFAFRIGITEGEVGPLDTYAPLEMLTSPALGGYRLRVGGAYDHSLLQWLRARAYADGFLHGATEGPGITVRAGVGLDLAVGDSGRFTLGAIWWNSDQGAHEEQGNFQRSNDFYPTVDFLWTW